jgi:hypothetical protein
MLKSAALLAFGVSILLGCAANPAPDRASSQPITNDQGHVIGHRAREVVTYYTPRYDPQGTLIGYQEQVRDGVVLRSVDGRRIGTRYSDLRSRGSNPGNDGIGIVVPAAQGKSAP